MSQQRDEQHSRTDRGGYQGRGQDEQETRYRDQPHPEQDRFGRGGPERFGGEDFGSRHDYGWRSGEAHRELGRRDGSGGGRGESGRGGEEDFRDYGRGQPGGTYEHAGERGYRHGGGYGGFGRQPGEAGGGFSSGQSYASEPGWGPGYGGEGRSLQSGQGSGQGQYGQSFGEAGRTYGEQGFGQSRYGYGHESERRRRAGRGPKGYQRSDERLKEDICERLMNADHIDAGDVSVEVKDGKVSLEGTVSQRRMKHAIEDIVDDCIGVKDIDNRVRVSHGEEKRAETNTSIGSSQGSGGPA